MNKEHHNLTRRSISSRSDKKQKKPRIEVSAGGLVFKRTKHGVLFAMVRDSYGKWTFPKGHVRRGESNEDAAEREVWEEIGLKDLKLIKKLGHIDIWFKDRYIFKGRLIHKFIYFFLFECHANARLRRQAYKKVGENIQEVAWVSSDEVLERSRYKDMKPLVKKALEFLKHN